MLQTLNDGWGFAFISPLSHMPHDRIIATASFPLPISAVLRHVL